MIVDVDADAGPGGGALPDIEAVADGDVIADLIVLGAGHDRVARAAQRRLDTVDGQRIALRPERRGGEDWAVVRQRRAGQLLLRVAEPAVRGLQREVFRRTERGPRAPGVDVAVAGPGVEDAAVERERIGGDGSGDNAARDVKRLLYVIRERRLGEVD